MKSKSFAYSQRKQGWNTFIGGVSATILTPALLATKLSIIENRIINFEIVGSDIKCRIIGGQYPIPSTAFLNNTDITYYTENEPLVSNTGNFEGCTNLAGKLEFLGVINNTSVARFIKGTQVTEVNLPNLLTWEFNDFWRTPPSNVIFRIPKATLIGDTQGNDNGTLGFNATHTIYANTYLQTSNGGLEEGDIAYARSQGTTIIYV